MHVFYAELHLRSLAQAHAIGLVKLLPVVSPLPKLKQGVHLFFTRYSPVLLQIQTILLAIQ